jgi:hypothetical protein
MFVCSHCGSKATTRVGPPRALETWRCAACGENFDVLADYPDILKAGGKPLKPVYRLLGRWLEPPDPAGVAALRRLAPFLRPLVDVGMDDPYAAERFEIGRYTEDELIETDLEAKLTKIGVAAGPEPVIRPGVGRR